MQLGLRVFRSRRASVVEVMLSPVFNIAVAALVGFVLMGAIAKISSDDSFERRFIATDIGLFMDSLAGVRQDVSVQADLTIPQGMQVKLSPRTVEIWSTDPASKETFWFSETPKIKYEYGTIQNVVSFFRSPVGMGVGTFDTTKPAVTCQTRPKGLSIQAQRLDALESSPSVNELASGDVKVYVRVSEGQKKIVRLFVSEGGADAACVLAEQIAQSLEGIDGVAIIPFDSKFIANSDVRKGALQHQRGVFVDASIQKADQAKLLRGLYEGVRVLG